MNMTTQVAIIQSKLKPLYKLLAIKETPHIREAVNKLEDRLEKIRRITT